MPIDARLALVESAVPDKTRGENSAAESVQSLVESPGVRLLCFRQSFKPFRQLEETFITGSLRKTRIHFGIFVGLAFNSRFQVFLGASNRHSRARIAHLLEKIEMAEGMSGFRLRGVPEKSSDIGIAFDISDSSEIEIATIGLGLAGKRFLQVLVTLASG